jgi:chemotaxis response regulator CheB
MEKHIRVLVANRFKLMREVIIATFNDQPDIEVVGDVPEDEDILSYVEKTSPDFLFIGLDDPEKRPAVCDSVLKLHPEVSIIAVAPDRNCSVRYWASFDIHSTALETSEQGILAAMRNRRAFA